jgi:hypothetical protein
MVGRQEVRLGSGLLIGDPDTNQTSIAVLPARTRDLSMRKAFDGVVGILDYDPLVVTLGYLKADEDTWGNEDDDENVYLANAAYAFEDDWNSSAEAYYVISDQKKDSATKDINNVGIRGTSTPLENLTVNGEYCHQWKDRNDAVGSDSESDDGAIILGATYDLEDDMEQWIDTIGVDFTRLGSDWSVMYEDQAPASIANAILNNTNLQVVGLTATAKPTDDVSVKLRYANLRSIEARSSADVSTFGTMSVDSNKKTLGDEVDLTIMYDYSEDVQLGLDLGYFDPGKAFASPREEAIQVIGSMKVTF